LGFVHKSDLTLRHFINESSANELTLVVFLTFQYR